MKTNHSRMIHSPLAWLAMAMLVLSGTLPAQVIPGRYIAVLKQDTRDTPGAAKALAAQHNLDVDHVYTRALKGFAFNGSEQAAQALARRAEIAYVEPDQIYTAFQQTVPTGIRRSAAAAVPGLIGSGLTVDADVAVIDTGLDGTHPDLNVMSGGVRFYMLNANKCGLTATGRMTTATARMSAAPSGRWTTILAWSAWRPAFACGRSKSSILAAGQLVRDPGRS
jgi:hypothetical protein